MLRSPTWSASSNACRRKAGKSRERRSCVDLRETVDSIVRQGPGALWAVAETPFSPYHARWPRAIVIAQPYEHFKDCAGYNEEAFHAVLEETKFILDEKIGRIGRLLEGQGIDYWLPPLSQRDEASLEAPFPFKRAAVQAGLGWIGKSSVLVTPQYGPRVRLGAILLDHPLVCGMPVTSGSCGACHACADACPWRLIRGAEWNPSVTRDALLDYRECNRQRSRYLAAHGRKHECGRCLLACPRGLKDSEEEKNAILRYPKG